MRNVFGKDFRKEVGGYGSKIFMGSFASTLHGFLLFSPAFLTKSRSSWYMYGWKDLFTLHK